MADLAIEFYDQAGRLSVAAGLLGFVCRKSGSGFTVPPGFRTSAPSAIFLDVAAYTYPIILFQCESGVAQYGQNARSGAIFACQGGQGTPYNYFIFDWTPNLPASPVGIARLWRQDGTVSFDSSYWPLKLVGTLSGAADGQISAAGGASLAVGTNGIGGFRYYGEGTCYDGGGPVLDPGEGLASCKDIRGTNDAFLYGGRTAPGGAAAYSTTVSFDQLEYSYGDFQEYSNPKGTWEAENLVLVGDVAGIPIGQTFF